jgi:hypothetical protein
MYNVKFGEEMVTFFSSKMIINSRSSSWAWKRTQLADLRFGGITKI